MFDTEAKINSLGASFATAYYRLLLEADATGLTAMHAPSADVATSLALGVTLPGASGQALGSHRNNHAPGTATGLEVARRVALIRATLMALPTPAINVLSVDAVRTAAGLVLVTVTSQLGGEYAVVHSACLATVGNSAYIVGDTMRILPAAVTLATETEVSVTNYRVEPPPKPATPKAAPKEAAAPAPSSAAPKKERQPRERRGKGEGRGDAAPKERGGRQQSRESDPDSTLVLKGVPLGGSYVRQNIFKLAKLFGWVDSVEIDYDRDQAKIVFTDPDGAARMMTMAKREGIYMDDQRVRVDYFYPY